MQGSILYYHVCVVYFHLWLTLVVIILPNLPKGIVAGPSEMGRFFAKFARLVPIDVQPCLDLEDFLESTHPHVRLVDFILDW